MIFSQLNWLFYFFQFLWKLRRFLCEIELWANNGRRYGIYNEACYTYGTRALGVHIACVIMCVHNCKKINVCASHDKYSNSIIISPLAINLQLVLQRLLWWEWCWIPQLRLQTQQLLLELPQPKVLPLYNAQYNVLIKSIMMKEVNVTNSHLILLQLYVWISIHNTFIALLKNYYD